MGPRNYYPFDLELLFFIEFGGREQRHARQRAFMQKQRYLMDQKWQAADPGGRGSWWGKETPRGQRGRLAFEPSLSIPPESPQGTH